MSSFYGTRNPMPSIDPRDLDDNARHIDEFANSPQPTAPDRFEVDHLTLEGIRQAGQTQMTQQQAQFAALLSASGRTDKGVYPGSPLITLTTRADVFSRNGVYYRAAPATVLPYTLTGTWATDNLKVVIDSSSLSLSPAYYGAQGDAVSNDTAAFTALETAIPGMLVNLENKKYLVDAVPTKCGYFNGSFKVSGFTKAAVIAGSFAAQPPRVHRFGGQLATLFKSLTNPLEQMTGIAAIGDSQVWGSGNGSEQAPTGPRDGTLSDARDYFATSSFINILKRYIGKNFARGATPVLTNHPTSPTGQSIATYTTTNILFPSDGDFTRVQAAGSGISATVAATPVPITYAQLQLQNSNTAVEIGHTVSFNFTGTTFKLGFGCTDVTATYYELFVGGVSQGIFSTHAGVDGFVDVSNNNFRTHTFGYVRNALIEIKTRRNGETGNRILRLESITIDKVIRITNNGINGASSLSYRVNNLTGTPADGFAVLPDDNHVIVKIGTNDRISATSRPKGSNTFKANYMLLLDAVRAISPTVNIVLCCSNPAAEDPATYSFTMQEVRNVIYQVAKAQAVDMVDVYALFSSVTLVPAFSADGLHLNQLGYDIEARNFINALESAQ